MRGEATKLVSLFTKSCEQNTRHGANFIHKLFTGDMGCLIDVSRETSSHPFIELLRIPGDGVFFGLPDTCDAHPSEKRLR